MTAATTTIMSVDTPAGALPVVVERLVAAVYDLLEADTLDEAIAAAYVLKDKAKSAKEFGSAAANIAREKHVEAKLKQDVLPEIPAKAVLARRQREQALRTANERRFAVAKLKREMHAAGDRRGEDGSQRRARQLPIVLRVLHDPTLPEASIRMSALLELIWKVDDKVVRLFMLRGQIPDRKVRQLSDYHREQIIDYLLHHPLITGDRKQAA